MAFNVAEFRAVTSKKGFAVDNLFVLRVNFPLVNLGGILGALSGREIPFYCRSVALPSLDVAIQDIKVQGFGTGHKRAMGMEHGTLPAVFMVDADFNIKKLFHAWNQSIYNHGNGGSVLAGVDGRKIYEMNYKDDYSAAIDVVVYSYNSEEIVYNYRFNGAFPVSVGNPTLAWENSAQVMTMPVNFAYDSITMDGANIGSLTGLGSGNGFLGFINSINNIGQAINQLSVPQNVTDLLNQVNTVGTIVGNLPGVNR